MKACGPCTMCCRVLAVAELDKPAGRPCAHAKPGAGCGIYEHRPQGCRVFECVWLMDPEMPHRFRPDQTKVVLDQDARGQRLVARCDPANPLAWRRNPIYAALKGRAADTWGTGRIVLAVAGRRTWLIAPREDVDLGEVGAEATLQVIERADGSIVVEVRQG
ncbi:YkgJ family cysteine cluster protein [Phenylobacterium sp.]|uniref:YkgJ family cysteine cluster protein n=1 Tax=Phenylobacterium sp. TaxID=1871053 RepID=UPI00301C4F05